VPKIGLLHALGGRKACASLLSICPNHIKYQIIQRTHCQHLSTSTKCERNDISGGQERAPIPIARDAPEMQVQKLVYQYRQGEKVYVRFPIESKSVCCMFHVKGNAAPQYFCSCSHSKKCEPTNNKGNSNDCGGKHCQEQSVYHVCNFLCSCSMKNLQEPCGGTDLLLGISVPIELFWRTEMSEWGLRATACIPPNTVIGEYAGLLKTGINDVTVAKVKTTSGGKTGFEEVFLSAFSADPKSTKKQIHVEIDAGKFRGATYYINHACKDSNLEVVQFCDASRQLQLDSSGKIIPFRRNLFVTKKKINEGEELTFVYEKKGGRGSTNTFLDGKDCYCTHCCNKRGFD